MVEFIVVTLVIVLFLGGVLVPFSAYLRTSRISATQTSLDAIRDRLYEFAARNGRLPCPADPTGTSGVEWVDPTTSRCLGIPAAAGSPAVATGVVPWTTLGVAEADAWGDRFTYSVQSEWADGALDAGCTARDRFMSFCAASPATLGVLTRNAAGAPLQSTGIELAAVIVSHGPNMRGAYASGGSARPAPVGTDELQNRLVLIGPGEVQQIVSFVSRDSTPDASPCDDTSGGTLCEYDDRMVLVSKAQLLARMFSEGRGQ